VCAGSCRFHARPALTIFFFPDAELIDVYSTKFNSLLLFFVLFLDVEQAVLGDVGFVCFTPPSRSCSPETILFNLRPLLIPLAAFCLPRVSA